MNVKEGLLYTKTHEWVEDLGGGRCRVGLTDYAQDQLGDIVFVRLPDIGERSRAGEPLTDVESVKAVSDVYSPVDGAVTAVNEALEDNPGTVNEDPYGAWIAEITYDGALDMSALADAAAYKIVLEGLEG